MLKKVCRGMIDYLGPFVKAGRASSARDAGRGGPVSVDWAARNPMYREFQNLNISWTEHSVVKQWKQTSGERT